MLLRKMEIAVCLRPKPTELVVWRFCAKSTVPPLRSSLLENMGKYVPTYYDKNKLKENLWDFLKIELI